LGQQAAGRALMGMFSHFLRDLEQIVFPDRDWHPIPAMDGALTPNDLLDACAPVGDPIPGVDDVVAGPDGALYASAGSEILRFSGEEFRERSVFATVDGVAGALAWHRDDRLLVCVAGHGLLPIPLKGARNGSRSQTPLTRAGDEDLECLTAVAVAADGTVFLTDGSSRNRPDDWARDLMEKNALGRLIVCRPALNGARVVQSHLAWPHGVALAADGRALWFSESWSHRLSRVAVDGDRLGRPEVVIGNMPGYPGRLSRAAAGGFWLASFAVRTHLIEFVLREDDFRTEMMRTIAPPLWIAPALNTTNDSQEPMQFGNIKALGIEKPWAPPRSYGLLVRIDGDGEPLESLHSRRGGVHHGITASCESAHGLVIVSKGSGRLLRRTTGGKA